MLAVTRDAASAPRAPPKLAFFMWSWSVRIEVVGRNERGGCRALPRLVAVLLSNVSCTTPDSELRRGETPGAGAWFSALQPPVATPCRTVGAFMALGRQGPSSSRAPVRTRVTAPPREEDAWAQRGGTSAAEME
ncbi:unnamed protein product [Lampetra planeri]